MYSTWRLVRSRFLRKTISSSRRRICQFWFDPCSTMTMSSCGQLRCDVVYQFVYTTVWCRISLPLSRARERKAVYKVGVSTVRVAFLLSPPSAWNGFVYFWIFGTFRCGVVIWFVCFISASRVRRCGRHLDLNDFASLLSFWIKVFSMYESISCVDNGKTISPAWWQISQLNFPIPICWVNQTCCQNPDRYKKGTLRLLHPRFFSCILFLIPATL